MKKHLVLVGGGHAHMTTLKKLNRFTARGHRVTVISRSPYQYYSGMGPGMLAGIYRPEEIRFPIKKMAEKAGGAFVEGEVLQVDPKVRRLTLSSGDKVSYDVVSFNTGSYVPLDRVVIESKERVFPVKPIENLLRAQENILDLMGKGKPRILIVGGGAAGVEIAGNAWRLISEHGGEAKLSLLAGKKLLSRFPEDVERLVRKSFKARGIEVVEGTLLRRLERRVAILDDARHFPFDLVFMALGIKPSSIFSDSGLPVGQGGGLLVNNYLQSVYYSEVFGGGDCISFQARPLDKVGVYAVRQNPVLYHNLSAALEGKKLKPFYPGGHYLLIFNLGNGRGVFCRNKWVFDGKGAFLLKNYLDRKFMRLYQT